MPNKSEFEDFYRNCMELKDENKRTLLLVGEKLLWIKKLVMDEDNAKKKIAFSKCNDKTVV